MANIMARDRDLFMLKGPLSRKGYDWWWHSFTGYHEKTGEERSFFIEFFTCNPALGGDEPVLGQTTDHPLPSYLMVKCGCWGKDHAQLHRFFGWNHVSISRKKLLIKAKDCCLSETATKGNVTITKEDAALHPQWMCDSGSMKWKLRIDKKVAFHVGYGAGRLFRCLNSFEMFWHAQGMKTAYSGWVEFNGERYLVRPDTCFGYADKNWGSDFTSPWVWLSSCNLTSKITKKQLTDSVFDIGGGRPKAFGIALNRKLLSSFWYEGKNYEFNFSKFWTFTRTRFSCTETDSFVTWHVDQQTWRYRMVTDITCKKEDMLLVNYESPDGCKRHNHLLNGGTGTGVVKLYKKRMGQLDLIDEIEAKNVGCEYGEYDR